jgi:hypothetical protein
MDNSDTCGKEEFISQMEESEESIRKNLGLALQNPGHKSCSGFTRKDGSYTNLEASTYPISSTKDAKFFLVSLREIPVSK